MGANWLRRTILLASVFCLVIGCLVVLGSTRSSAVSTAYYVDNTAPCPGAGTQASPWCDFSLVNATTFQPGDQVLLRRGDTFTTSMFLIGSGTPSNYVTVAPYGSGAAPIINGNDSLSFIGIHLYNDSYVQIEGLSIENSLSGILIDDASNQTGYRFLDLTLAGDWTGIQAPVGTNTGIASNMLIQDVTGANNRLSCASGACTGPTVLLGHVTQVVINRLNSYDNCRATAWYLGSGASNVVIENSQSLYDADCQSQGGSTANFLDDDNNVTFVNDIIADVPVETVDLSAIDIEPNYGPDNGISIEDDYIANNAGPGIEILDHKSPITSLNISGNVFSENGTYTRPVGYPQHGQIWTDQWQIGWVPATGSITNNLYNAPAPTGGFEVMHARANFNGFTQSDNLDVSGTNNVWYAANGFSCSNAQGADGWSYQSSANSSTWTNLAGCRFVNPLDQEWSNGGTSSGFVSNFEELPPSSATSWVARSWTAPSSGSVSLRGRVLMTNPTCSSGVTAEITKNGSSAPIWGPQVINAGDGVGVDANLDGVKVNAGDVLHFAVQEKGSSQCRVSWTPSVGIPNPVSTVVVPSSGTTVAKTQTLDATAADSASPISNVEYLLTGGSLNDTVIAPSSTPTPYGWVASWQSESVPSGTYTLQSLATDAAGNVAYSPGVTITVDHPTTSVVLPSNGSWVSGTTVSLQAAASDSVGVTKVEFHLTGGSLNDALIATATQTSTGWQASWNSTTVPDGTYTLQTEAYNTIGNVGVSTGSTIIVENKAPSTSISVPAAGATVSGTKVVLDAQASLNVGVTRVTFRLTGGSLSNLLVATATKPTPYGWIAYWNTTTVPNGTYSLRSIATDGAGHSGASSPISVTVAN